MVLKFNSKNPSHRLSTLGFFPQLHRLVGAQLLCTVFAPAPFPARRRPRGGRPAVRRRRHSPRLPGLCRGHRAGGVLRRRRSGGTGSGQVKKVHVFILFFSFWLTF